MSFSIRNAISLKKATVKMKPNDIHSFGHKVKLWWNVNVRRGEVTIRKRKQKEYEQERSQKEIHKEEVNLSRNDAELHRCATTPHFFNLCLSCGERFHEK